jgi:hypothetical protein
MRPPIIGLWLVDYGSLAFGFHGSFRAFLALLLVLDQVRLAVEDDLALPKAIASGEVRS